MCTVKAHSHRQFFSSPCPATSTQGLTFLLTVKFWATPESTSYVPVLVLLVSKRAPSLWFVVFTVTKLPDVINTSVQPDLHAQSYFGTMEENYKPLDKCFVFFRSLPIRNAPNKWEVREVVPTIDTHLKLSATELSGIHIPVFVTECDVTIQSQFLSWLATPDEPIYYSSNTAVRFAILVQRTRCYQWQTTETERHDLHQLFYSRMVPRAPEDYSIKLRWKFRQESLWEPSSGLLQACLSVCLHISNEAQL